MKNIVLIGLPGCGKSTIGRILSQKLKMNFYDLDEFIQELNKKTIEEMFDISEEFFRNKETEAIEKMKNINNSIIATGGGTVKKRKNMEMLKRNSIIIYIDRKVELIVEDIDEEKRPLLKGKKNNIFLLEKERAPLYRLYSDITIENNKNIEEAIDKIMEQLLLVNINN